MAENKVVIIDYGMGNLWSVASAIEFVGHTSVISDDPSMISKASVLILPGVGSFRKAMQTIKEKSIDMAILESLQKPRSKILGICLGMQLLGVSSTEDGLTPGLGLVMNEVTKLASHEKQLKIPHVGFNIVQKPENSKLFDQFSNDAAFYFVHSYAMQFIDGPQKCAMTTYGQKFVSAIETDQVFGTQFHPEKSQKNGLRVLENFMR